jgi:hypothetical protein
VRVIASAGAVELVRRQGGRLYVWPKLGRCCAHGLAWLETGAEPSADWKFEAVPTDGFELFLARMGRVPDELHVDVAGRRRRRVAAYWDNCAWVT